MNVYQGIGLGLLLLGIVGCEGTGTNTAGGSPDTMGATSSNYLVTTEPEGVMPVGEARQSVVDQQDVTLVGNIGGSTEPFVEGIAAFTIVDPKVPYCAPDEGCSTPWDYCCTQDQVKDNIATIKFVDDSGRPVTEDAKSLLGVKELSTVVVTGKAQRDEQGNLTVAARQIFVRQP